LLEQGAAAAMLAAAPPAAIARRADRPNVVVIVVDTLRADHVYGDRARTPNMDALARGGVRFVDTHPEAMPTIPARNSLLQGRRQFPFRGWRDYPGLIDEPGWEPLDRLSTSLTTALRRAGYWTAYATDNAFIGFSSPTSASARASTPSPAGTAGSASSSTVWASFASTARRRSCWSATTATCSASTAIRSGSAPM